jgi:hemerythrin superfamily protein
MTGTSSSPSRCNPFPAEEIAMYQELFKTLKQDHKEVKSIFSELKSSSQSSERKNLLEKLRRELLPHMTGEEKALYPALKKTEAIREDALEALEEHHAAQLILTELTSMSPDDERFKAKVTVLMEMVDHHVEEEEDVIFKDVKKQFSSDEAGQLLENFNKEKEKAKKSMH